MKYVSTRGGMDAQVFSEVLLEGLAPDGGLAIPQTIPVVSSTELESWRSLNYADLAAKVLGYFVTDIPAQTLSQLTRDAYTAQSFQTDAIVPVKPLTGDMSLLGLSEGPTLAFKDMAMQFLGQIFPHVLAARHTSLNILGATSGDTGSAAE